MIALTVISLRDGWDRCFGLARARSASKIAGVGRLAGLVALVAYVSNVLGANLLLTHVGVVDIGFGLQAPAAVFAVGLALTLRDCVQSSLGRPVVCLAIVLGAGLSWLVAPSFAIASAVAFLVSEALDLAVYTPLADRTWLGAVLLSNIAGLLLDSLLFLTLAFGSLAFFWGQVAGKGFMTLIAVALLATWRSQRGVLARYA